MLKQKKSDIRLSKLKSKVYLIPILLYIFCNKITAQASNAIAESKAGTGIKNLFNDASLYLLVISPIAGGLFALYFLIRKNAADEQDQKQWNKRLIITGICVVGGVLVSSTINVVTGYFK